MKNKLAMIVGKNFEEIEMVATVDVLRRAGIKVDIISLFNETILTGSHQIKVMSDLYFIDIDKDEYDGIIIPGGPGVDKLDNPLIEEKVLIDLIKEFNTNNKMIAAICAAPQILGKAEVVNNKNITHFPGSDSYLESAKNDIAQPSIIDGKIITGASAGSAIQFALNIVEFFQGKESKEQLAKQLVMNYR